DVRRGLQVVEPRHRLGGCLRALPLHVRVHAASNQGRPPLGDGMRGRLGFLGVNAALAALAALTLFPLAWMVCASLMVPGEASTYPPPVLPASATLENYRVLFAAHALVRQAVNSLLISLLATALSLLFSLSAGYAFAKLRFWGRERIFRLLLGALVIPAQITMMPLFFMLKRMGLVNSVPGVLVPWLASVFGIYLVREYARSIPDELLEAARMDGAGEWRIFVKVVLPLLKPIIVTLAVIAFMGCWNDFMWPLVVLTDRDMQTLPVALATSSRVQVEAAIHRDPDGSVCLDYDFGNVSGYAVMRRPMPVRWPRAFALRVRIKGRGGLNDFQLKLVDASGDNVWWVNRPGYALPRELTD